MPDVAESPVADLERLDTASLCAYQERRLNALLSRVHDHSAIYARKLSAAGIQPGHHVRLPDGLATLPLTTKQELVADQDANPPWGSVPTEPITRFTRYNHTSGTSGRPLRWND